MDKAVLWGLVFQLFVFQGVVSSAQRDLSFRIEVIYGDKLSVFEFKTVGKSPVLLFHSSEFFFQRVLSRAQVNSLMTRINKISVKLPSTLHCNRKKIALFEHHASSARLRAAACLDGQTPSAQQLRDITHLLATIL